ncbi:MAG: hypothetical protein WDO56_32905 [Gammaproteobacteria bacterium]
MHILAVRNPYYWNNAANHLDGVKLSADRRRERRAHPAIVPAICTSPWVVPRGQFEWIQQNLGPELHIGPQLNTLLLRLQPGAGRRFRTTRPCAARCRW